MPLLITYIITIFDGKNSRRNWIVPRNLSCGWNKHTQVDHTSYPSFYNEAKLFLNGTQLYFYYFYLQFIIKPVVRQVP